MEYSLVARGRTVLAEHALSSSARKNRALAVQALQLSPAENNKYTLPSEDGTFNILTEGGYIFLVVADKNSGSQMPFAYLLLVKEEFLSRFAARGREASEGGLNKSFGPRLKHHMEFCTNNPEKVSQVAGLQNKVAEVRAILFQNIEEMIRRERRLDALDGQVGVLVASAKQFEHTSKEIRNKLWWQQKKILFIIIFLILCIAIIIFLSICFAGGNCFK